MAFPADKPAGSRRFVLIAASLAGLLVLAAGGLFGIAFRAAGTFPAGAIGGPFHLVDQNGKAVTDADLRGKWHLVFFGYTHCPDTCPTTLNELALALDKLSQKQRAEVRVVFISVDPERDTPAVLKSYVASFDAPIVALTGTPGEIKEAAGNYRVFYAKHPRGDGDYDMDHSAVIYVMDPQGRFTATFTPDSPADQIAIRLQKLLS